MGQPRPFGATERMLAAVADRVGLMESKTGIPRETNEPRDDGELDNATLGAILELGVPGEDGWRIPPRPAYDDAASENGRAWDGLMGQAVSEVAQGAFAGEPYRFPEALQSLGVRMRADVRRNIPYWSVENAESTKAQKGSDAPLIDTTDYANSIRSVGYDGVNRKVTG